MPLGNRRPLGNIYFGVSPMNHKWHLVRMSCPFPPASTTACMWCTVASGWLGQGTSATSCRIPNLQIGRCDRNKAHLEPRLDLVLAAKQSFCAVGLSVQPEGRHVQAWLPGPEKDFRHALESPWRRRMARWIGGMMRLMSL